MFHPCPLHVAQDSQDILCTGKIVKISTRQQSLDIGDYTLAGFEDIVAIERKFKVSELAHNIGPQDRRRFREALLKLASLKYPFLVVEGSSHEFFYGWTKSEYQWYSQWTLDIIVGTVLGMRITPLWMPRTQTILTRRRAGEFIVHLMLCVVLREAIESLFLCPQGIDPDVLRELYPHVQETAPQDRDGFIQWLRRLG